MVKILMYRGFLQVLIEDLQGDFFNWSPPKFSKYKSLYNLWHLEKFQSSLHGILYLENLGGLQLKKSPCMNSAGRFLLGAESEEVTADGREVTSLVSVLEGGFRAVQRAKNRSLPDTVHTWQVSETFHTWKTSWVAWNYLAK